MWALAGLARFLRQLLHTAMGRSGSFWISRELLKDSSYDIKEVVRAKLEVHDDGWTEQTLEALFRLEFSPLLQQDPRICRFCHLATASSGEHPWERTVQRIKAALGPNGPFDDDEWREEER